MHEDIKSVLITEEQIKKRVQEMGEQLSKEYEGKRVIIICLLKGAAFFACDLSRAMSIPVRMEFMVASSYGDGTTTSGSVAVRLDVKDDIAGMHVLLVDDIIDTGLTFARVKTLLETKKPASMTRKTDGRMAWRQTMWALPFRMNLWWAMVWIMRETTATCHLLVC